MAINLNDVLTLCKAGFTADQISGLINAEQPAPDPQPTPASDPQPAPQPALVPAPQPAPAPAPQPAPANPDPYERIMQELGTLRQAVQAGNINGAQQPPRPAPLTSEQILANIIRPTHQGNNT